MIETSIRIAPRVRRTAYGAALATAAILAGCQQPWYAARESSAESIAEAGDRLALDPRQGSLQPGIARHQSAAPGGVDPFEGAAVATSGEQALLDVLTELQNAEDIDAATREELIADLRAADPAHWPMIVQQLRSTLAYRRQLAQMEPASSATDAPSTETEPAASPHSAGGAVASDSSDAGPRPTPPRTTISSDANLARSGSAIAVDVEDSAAVPSSEGDAVAATPTPLPEPEPSESAMAMMQVATTEQVMPSVTDLEPTEVVAAAYQEPIYQTSGSTATGKADLSSDQKTEGSDHSWEDLLDLAIESLEGQTTTAPATSGEIARHARLRLLHLAAENDAEALLPIEGVPPNQQDFWAKQLFGLATYLDDAAQPDQRQRAALSQRHLQEATDLLGEMAVLEVRNLAFCSNIRGFGVYDPLVQPRFRASEQVKLYAEVANYRSEPTEDGFRTLLATSYEVLDESGRRVDSGEFPQVEDVCRSRRRDFHIQYGVNLPTRIYPGRYRLQITIEDMLSRKLGRSSVEFEIVDGSAETK